MDVAGLLDWISAFCDVAKASKHTDAVAWLIQVRGALEIASMGGGGSAFDPHKGSLHLC